MAPHRKPMRFAHSEGLTHVCYDDSGRYLLTGGTDGDVRVWEGIDDDDNQSVRVGDRVHALAFKKGRFFTASDTNSVQAHTFPESLPDGVYAKFTAPASQICFNVTGSFLAAGAEDFSIQIVNVETFARTIFSGHEAPVLSVSLDPKDEYLASSSCDGSVNVWKISDVKIEKSWNILPQSNDISLSKTMCQLCWDRTGKFLLVPVLKTIHVYERDTWTKTCELTDTSITQTISIVSLSDDGQYVAAACTDGRVVIFNWKSKQCVQKIKHEKDAAITSIAWKPTGNDEIAYCDNLGQLGIFEDVLSDVQPSQSKTKVPESVDSTMTMNDIFDDGDDDFLMNVDDDVDSDEDISKIKERVTQMVTGNNNPLISDDDSLPFPGSVDGEKSDAGSVVEAPIPAVERIKSTPLQQPFQSGSTPQHLTSRYMVWNSVGIIKQYSGDDENSIDIEFHDTSLHHAMHLSNSYNYTMADMSTEAVILASSSDDDSPSKFTCMHFGSWDNAKEWSVAMPDNEDITAITVGEGWLAIGTDQRNVRLFSIGGVQKQMFSIPGSVVCMTAKGNQLMVVFHKGAGLPGDQCLGVILMYVSGPKRAVLNGDALPLSPKAMLSWIGFSAEGTPFYMDSEGLIRMLNRKFGPSWIQVLNTKSHIKGKSDHYWIVSVNENPAQLRCIPCKGSKYPPTLPRPAVALLPFKLPFCEMDNEKSQYEENLLKTTLFANYFDHWTSQGYTCDSAFKSEALKPTQESLMKLFALSARQEREFRALEVCEMMEDQYTLQLAIKYATRLRHMNLAEKISDVAQRKLEENNTEDQEDEDVWYQQETPNVASTNGFDGSNNHDDNGNDSGGDGDIFENDMEDDEPNTPSGPRLAMNVSQSENTMPVLSTPSDSSQRKANPFKVSSSQKSTGKGSQVFDSLHRNKPKPVSVQPLLKLAPTKTNISKSTQKKATNLFKMKQQKPEKAKEPEIKEDTDVDKVPTAFELFLAENKDNVLTQNPEADEDELVKLCTDKFRGLEKEDKQKFIQKSKTLKSDSENKKRKRNIENSSDEANRTATCDSKKVKLSDNTTSKLSNFAFGKE